MKAISRERGYLVRSVYVNCGFLFETKNSLLSRSLTLSRLCTRECLCTWDFMCICSRICLAVRLVKAVTTNVSCGECMKYIPIICQNIEYEFQKSTFYFRVSETKRESKRKKHAHMWMKMSTIIVSKSIFIYDLNFSTFSITVFKCWLYYALMKTGEKWLWNGRIR